MDIVEKIRRGKIDCNNTVKFFPLLIKGLILDLNKEIKIRNISVPHMIMHTGEDTMYVDVKGYDHSKEPLEITNEDYMYSIIPRATLNPGGINILTDQITSPYSRGVFEYDSGEEIYTLSGEFRRMPIKMSMDIKYNTDSFIDMMELIQQIITKLSFIRTYNIVYMGQVIECSYSFPDSFDDQYLMELDGAMLENKNRVLEISLEIESYIPIFDNKTVISTDNIITNLSKHKINNHDIKTGYNIQVVNTGEIK